jgi:hypothetical protein
MYRPVQPTQNSVAAGGAGAPVRPIFFSEKNFNTLRTVLIQDFQERSGAPLNDQQLNRLSKTLDHYLNEVYTKQGEKPIQSLNREVLTASAKDFSQYLQRKEITKAVAPVKTVMDESLFQDTATRFERLTGERNEVKALPPAPPDFRISLDDDGPTAAAMFELAKKQREMEALRSATQANEMVRAEAGLQSRVASDSMFRAQQDTFNRGTELALAQRQALALAPRAPAADTTLAIMPDRRDLLLAPVGSFDTMTGSPLPRALGQANSNPTIVQPTVASPVKNDLPQNYVVREDSVVGYREVENNLFIYSADRDWLLNNKENRYSFTVNFDPAANSQSFGPSLGAQQKFRNIVRIELVKAIVAGESLDVTVNKNTSTSTTGYQDNILNFPYITVRVAELENNNYGTDNFLDRSFGVLQYDAQWISDFTNQSSCTKGYLAMIPKFLKCQKEYYPTPLATLQKMTIDIHRPNGELISTSPDTYDIGGIIASDATATFGTTFPFTVNNLSALPYGVLGNATGGFNTSCNFFINTTKYFSKFEVCVGDRIQIGGYTYSEDVLNNATYGGYLRDFCNWINRPEGHIVVSTAYSTNPTTVSSTVTNDVGYANFIIIQARYEDPTTGSTFLKPFGNSTNFIGDILNAFGSSLQSPCRLIDLNKQLNLVFRVITREMDSLPQLRPDNTF